MGYLINFAARVDARDGVSFEGRWAQQQAERRRAARYEQVACAFNPRHRFTRLAGSDERFCRPSCTQAAARKRGD